MAENIVIYHKNCLDGFGAAYAAWCKFGDEAEYISATYGEEPPDVTGKRVYIVDFSYPRDVLLSLHEKAEFLLVLDHHKTAQQDLYGLDFALFNMGKSGCILTWEYFFLKKAPELLLIIEDRDLWRFDYPVTKAVNQSLFLEPFDFSIWHEIVSKGKEGIKKLNEAGNYLLKSHNNQVDIAFKCSHPASLNEILGLAANATPNLASDLGHKLAVESGTFGLVYSYNGKKGEWMFNLRSNGDFDVSEIAKKFGGGGHKNAASFTSKVLRFETE